MVKSRPKKGQMVFVRLRSKGGLPLKQNKPYFYLIKTFFFLTIQKVMIYLELLRIKEKQNAIKLCPHSLYKRR